MAEPLQHTMPRRERLEREEAERRAALHQPGIGHPAASAQRHLLLVRANLAPPPGGEPIAAVRDGLARLGRLLARIAGGEKTFDELGPEGLVARPLSHYHFSATVGFGAGFFDALAIPAERRPRRIRAMPGARDLGDPAPYRMGQTDLILQLGASQEFLCRWVLEASPPVDAAEPGEAEDLVTALEGWATITDVHAGFQRPDGRNLQGFHDGVSNPRRLSPLFERVVWCTEDDEPAALAGGTYLAFQKIVHDLEQWKLIGREEQEEYTGRRRGTGLLLGTLPEEEDEALERAMASSDPAVSGPARARWKALFDAQSDPQARLYDHAGGDPDGAPLHGEIPRECPAWSHVRKANPRAEDGRVEEVLIFRRGYLFFEPAPDGTTRSGLLFVSFQRDPAAFERVKRGFLNDPRFPVPAVRAFTGGEVEERHRAGRFSVAALEALTPEQREVLGLGSEEAFEEALREAESAEAQQSGREGLASPSENGVSPEGETLATMPLGGGYYFVPPYLDRDPCRIGAQFF